MPAPTAAELQFWRFKREQIEEWNTVEVWPENVKAVDVFRACITQLRNSGYGATGLDYNALQFVMRMRKVPRREWPDLFEQIQVLEDTALHTLHMMAEREQERAKNARGYRRG